MKVSATTMPSGVKATFQSTPIMVDRTVYLSLPFNGVVALDADIAVAPLLAIWVGYGIGPIVLLCALMVFFPILVASVLGLRLVDPLVVDAALMDGAGSFSLLVSIELPLALPSILAGLRNGFALSVTGAVVGEMVMGGQGLGQLLTLQRDSVDTAGMFGTILVLCAMASALYGVISVIERRSATVADLTVWRAAHRTPPTDTRPTGERQYAAA